MKSPCHRCGEICCRCWRYAVVSILACVAVACSTTKPVFSPPLTPSPMPAPPALAQIIESSLQSARSVDVRRSNAVVVLRWDNTDVSNVREVWIYNTNGVRQMTVAGTNNNCTIRGLRDGDGVAFYAIAVNAEMDSEQSNIAVGTASKTPPWIVPTQEAYARRFTWKCAPGVTNVLQSSANLTTWATASRFRGTNGTAVVTLTNQLPFHRVLVQNATNVPPMTLTQSTAFIRLSWKNSPTSALFKLVDARTESFAPIWTNAGNGIVSLILPASADQYRVMSQ